MNCGFGPCPDSFQAQAAAQAARALIYRYGPQVLWWIEQCTIGNARCLDFLKAVYDVGKRAASDAVTGARDAFTCIDAACIQKALENIQRQQVNGTWEVQQAVPRVRVTKPTVITVRP